MNIKTIIAVFALVVAFAPAAGAQEVSCAAAGGTNCTGIIPDAPIPTPFTSTINLGAPLACPVGQAPSGFAVRLDIVHDYVGDLIAQLNSPGGVVSLLNRPAGSTPFGCAGEDVQATFAAAGPAPTCSEVAIPAVNGVVQATGGAAILAAGGGAGAYTLTVSDNSNGFEGFVRGWALVPQCIAAAVPAGPPRPIPTQSMAGLIATMIGLLALSGGMFVRRKRR